MINGHMHQYAYVCMYILVAFARRFGMGLIGPSLLYYLHIKAIFVAFLSVNITIHNMEMIEH